MFAPLPDPTTITVSEVERIPVNIVSGFLGSGKSTLINNWLHSVHAQDCAVIVNEFGEIGLDHLLVEHVAEDTVLLANGCLCCSVRSDLVSTLRTLFERRERAELPHYRRLIIETSGLADCAPIVQSFMTDPLRLSVHALETLTVTVDALLGIATLERHRLARRQIALADEILLTKTDRENSTSIDVLRARLRQYSNAPVRETQQWPGFERVGADYGTYRAGPNGEPHDVQPHFHNDDHCSVHRRFSEPVAEQDLFSWAQNMLSEVGEGILRVKGLLAIAERNKPHAFQCVQHIVDRLRPLQSWPTEQRVGWIEVIASRSCEAAVQAHLENFCRATRQDSLLN